MTLSIRSLVPKYPRLGTSLWKAKRTTFSRAPELGSLVCCKHPSRHSGTSQVLLQPLRQVHWVGVGEWRGGWGGGVAQREEAWRRGWGWWRGRGVGLRSFPKPLGRARGGERKIGEATKEWNPYHPRRPPACPTASRAQLVSPKYPLFASSSRPQP